MKYVQVIVPGERQGEIVARMKELGFLKIWEPPAPLLDSFGWCSQGTMVLVTAEGEVDQIEFLFEAFTEMGLWDDKVSFRKNQFTTFDERPSRLEDK